MARKMAQEKDRGGAGEERKERKKERKVSFFPLPLPLL